MAGVGRAATVEPRGRDRPGEIHLSLLRDFQRIVDLDLCTGKTSHSNEVIDCATLESSRSSRFEVGLSVPRKRCNNGAGSRSLPFLTFGDEALEEPAHAVEVTDP